MNNYKKYFTLLAVFVACSDIEAGGGIVGNSPLTAAFNNTKWMLPHTAKDMEDWKNENSLLLSEGERELSVGFGKVFFSASKSAYTYESGLLRYTQSLGNGWDLTNFTALSKSLKASGGEGHELALQMGLIKGFGVSFYQSTFGDSYEIRKYNNFHITPGFSLLHSWTTHDWRWVNSISFFDRYSYEESSAVSGIQSHRFSFQLRSGIFHRLTDTWSMGFSAESFYEYAKYDSDSYYSSYDLLIAKPSLSFAKQLNENSKVEILIGSDGDLIVYDRITGIRQMGLFLNLSTKWK